MDSQHDNFAYLDQPVNSTSGFTNKWLVSRHSDQLFTERYPDHSLFADTDVTKTEDTSGYYRDILKTIRERTPNSDFFFSQKNINHLKKLLCERVSKCFNNIHGTNIYLCPQSQSTSELLTVMRSIYLTNATNSNGGKTLDLNEISGLNKDVYDYLFQRFYTNVLMELTYQRDAGQMPMPMERSINISSAGTKSNRMADKQFI